MTTHRQEYHDAMAWLNKPFTLCRGPITTKDPSAFSTRKSIKLKVECLLSGERLNSYYRERLASLSVNADDTSEQDILAVNLPILEASHDKEARELTAWLAYAPWAKSEVPTEAWEILAEDRLWEKQSRREFVEAFWLQYQKEREEAVAAIIAERHRAEWELIERDKLWKEIKRLYGDRYQDALKLLRQHATTKQGTPS